MLLADSRVLALCRCLTSRYGHGVFCTGIFCFCWGIYFPDQPESTLELHETNIQATAAWQRRDSIGESLHHLRRSVAVRSDSRVMVMRLQLDSIQRNEWSRRTFVAWIFTSCTAVSGIIKNGSVFMSTPKRLLHFSTLVRIRRVSPALFICIRFFQACFSSTRANPEFIWNK